MQSGTVKLRLLVSPWADTFETFARSIAQTATIVSPFITAEPLQRMAHHLQSRRSPQIEILTNLAVDSMVQGSISPQALVEFCGAIPSTQVRHLPGLHAKVYVADKREAIISSANLTSSGLVSNLEYGIHISDPVVVKQIVDDLEGYATLGAEVSLTQLNQWADMASQLRSRHLQLVASARSNIRDALQEQVEAAQELLLELRAESSQSTNAIFSRTVLYLLKRGPLTTTQLHPLVQQIHPDLCDDSIDRVIRGVHFGKRWKHMVRNAQQRLKQQGLINFNGQEWYLATAELTVEPTP